MYSGEGRQKTIVLWQNTGQSAFYTFAAQDAKWLGFQAGTGTPGTPEYVPGSAFTTSATATSASATTLAGCWFIVPLGGPGFIGLELITSLTATTGNGTISAASSPLRVFAQFLQGLDPAGDPDFNLPPMAGTSVLDSVNGITTNSHTGQMMVANIVQSDADAATSGWNPSHGFVSASVRGLVVPSSLTSTANKRSGWSIALTGRQISQTETGSATQTISPAPYSWPWALMALQVQGGVVSAAGPNDIATIAMKAQLRLNLVY